MIQPEQRAAKPIVFALVAMLAVSTDAAMGQDSAAQPDNDSHVVTGGGAAGTIVSYNPNLSPQPSVTVPVRIRVDSLLDEVGSVGLICRLESSLLARQAGGTHILGSGYAVAVRAGQDVDAHVDHHFVLYHTFSGDSIDLTFNVPFFTDMESNYPMEYWTHGTCGISIHHTRSEDFELPHTCTAGMMADAREAGHYGERVLACVWPGTDPGSADIEFTRPALDGLNATTGRLRQEED